MLLLDGKGISKSHGDRLLFRCDEIKVRPGERLGIVGANGAGKTTLLNILAGIDTEHQGTIRRAGKQTLVSQTGPAPPVDAAAARAFGVAGGASAAPSGGEVTRLKLAAAFAAGADIILADEPTGNLDLPGIQKLEDSLKNYGGAVLLISHDRALLDAVCGRILEIADGKITFYCGNYSDYRQQKEAETARQSFLAAEYRREKARLLTAIAERKEAAKEVRKAPARMGNSEARLHKRKAAGKQAKIESRAKNLATKLRQLTEQRPPAPPAAVRLKLPELPPLTGKTALRGENITATIGDRVLFDKASFILPTGRKAALLGRNGSGKTTLLRLIIEGSVGIMAARGARFGYLSQTLGELNDSKTVLANVMETSRLSETEVRTILAGLRFRRDAVDKPAAILSGGERVKVALARVFTGDNNVIILDEPTNYLDLYALEALEELLRSYRGTLLFVSHDRRFVDVVADQIMLIENKKIIQYAGNYSQYRARNTVTADDRTARILLLENRLSETISRLSLQPDEQDKADLEKIYAETRRELQELRSSRQ
ncbi:MAG: ribosomal protection-like ABC-F family protein [bacterium]|jgi:macrolide transport system ATP-binding/permease protein